MIRVLATATFLKPPEHSGTVSCPPLSGGMKPPPNCLTSVNVCGSPPWSVTATVVPCLTVTSSGSKSQPGSGWPWATELNSSESEVVNPSAARPTFLQKSGPKPPSLISMLKLWGSHSSSATICATVVCSCDTASCATNCGTPANAKQPANRTSLGRTAVFSLQSLLTSNTNEPPREHLLNQVFWLESSWGAQRRCHDPFKFL